MIVVNPSWLTVALLALTWSTSAVAHAEPPGLARPLPPLIEPGLPDRSGLPDPAAHLVLGFGVDLGRAPAGTMSGYGGLHALFGIAVDRVALFGELDGMILDGRAESVFGALGRAAVDLRVSLWRGVRPEKRKYGSRMLVRAELWLEPAVGYEDASQDRGPALHRPDLALGIGYQQTRHEAEGSNGTYAALRMIVADAPGADEHRRDVAILFTSGVLLGW